MKVTEIGRERGIQIEGGWEGRREGTEQCDQYLIFMFTLKRRQIVHLSSCFHLLKQMTIRIPKVVSGDMAKTNTINNVEIINECMGIIKLREVNN